MTTQRGVQMSLENKQRTQSCPTCGVDFLAASSSALPFCSMRCKQIDLGRWFNEEIGLPVESDAIEEEWDA